MKIGIPNNKIKLVLSLATAITFGMVGCGGGGGGGDAPPATTPVVVSSDLKGAMYPTLNTAPVISSTVLRQTDVPITNANITYAISQSGVAGFGAANIRVASAITDTNGVASFAVPAGSYTAKLSGLPADVASGENAPYYASESVSASGNKTYKADQYAWTITSPVAMSNIVVRVYQLDSSGNVDWGNYTNAADPWAGTVTPSLRNPVVYAKTTTLANVTQVIENAELFKGSYRLVITGTPAATTDSLAAYISDVFTVSGTGGTNASSIALAAPSKAPTVTLNSTTGTPLVGYNVAFYEKTNHIFLGTVATNASGVASIGAPSGVTSIVAKIYDATNAYKGVYVFNDITTSSVATLQQFTVQGMIQPSAGNLDSTAIPIVYARTDSTLGRWADYDEVTSVNATAGTGTFNLTLFGGTTSALNYRLGARNVKGFPDITETSIAVTNAALTSQTIAAAPGGVILGKIQTEGKIDLANIGVSVYGASADGVIEEVNATVTNATGDYSMEVPYGTYFLLVEGAITDGITISATAPTFTKNLTRFSMTGQVSKSLGTTTAGANGASVMIGFLTATTSSLGVYTLNVYEGKNWICAAPSAANDPTYGYACNLNVLVDATTVAAARQ